MAYGRRFKKRSMRKRTRKTTRKFNITRKKASSGMLRLIRMANLDAVNNCYTKILGNNVLPANTGTSQFRLDDVNGVGELKSLFDNYRITKVLYRFVLDREVTSTTNQSGIFPRINWVHDFNDGISISRNQMMQHAGMREHWFNNNSQKTRWYTLKCASLVQQYESSVATAYKPVWGSWVDTTDSAMPHYGLKIAWDNLYAGWNIIMECKYVIECKGIS